MNGPNARTTARGILRVMTIPRRRSVCEVDPLKVHYENGPDKGYLPGCAGPPKKARVCGAVC
jgi:hypothetical protein